MSIQADYGSSTSCHLVTDQALEVLRHIVQNTPSNLPPEEYRSRYVGEFTRFFEATRDEVRRLIGQPTASAREQDQAWALLQHADGVLQALYLGNNLAVGPRTGLYAQIKQDSAFLAQLSKDRKEAVAEKQSSNIYDDSDELNRLLEERDKILSQAYIQDEYLMSIKRSIPTELDAYTLSEAWQAGMVCLAAFDGLLQNDAWRLGLLHWEGPLVPLRTQVEEKAVATLAKTGVVVEELPVGSQDFYRVLTRNARQDFVHAIAAANAVSNAPIIECLKAICETWSHLESLNPDEGEWLACAKQACATWSDGRFYALFNQMAALANTDDIGFLASEIKKRSRQGRFWSLGSADQVTPALSTFTIPPVLSGMGDAGLATKSKILRNYAAVADCLDREGEASLAHTVRAQFVSPMVRVTPAQDDTIVRKMAQSILYGTPFPNEDDHPVDNDLVTVMEDVKTKYYQYDGLTLLQGVSKAKSINLGNIPRLDTSVHFSVEPIIEGAFLTVMESAPDWFEFDTLYPLLAAHGCMNPDALPIIGAQNQLAYAATSLSDRRPLLAAVISHTAFTAANMRHANRYFRTYDVPFIRPGKEEQALLLLHDAITHSWLTADYHLQGPSEEDLLLYPAGINERPDVAEPYFLMEKQNVTGNINLPNEVAVNIPVKPGSDKPVPDVLDMWRDDATVQLDLTFANSLQEDAFYRLLHQKTLDSNRAFKEVLPYLDMPHLQEKVMSCLGTLEALPSDSTLFRETVCFDGAYGINRPLPGNSSPFFSGDGDFTVPNLRGYSQNINTLLAYAPDAVLHLAFSHADGGICEARRKIENGAIIPSFGGERMAELNSKLYQMSMTAETMLSQTVENGINDHDIDVDPCIDFS